MPITKELTERILRNTNIVNVISHYISVTRKGREYLAICPFHDDSNPSLHISEEKQIFKCFVDGVGGNAFDFVMAYEKVNFPEAVKRVAKISGIDDPALHENVGPKVDPNKKRLYDLLDDLNKYYVYCLATPEGKAALDYLESRDIKEDLRRTYEIGYAPVDGEKTLNFLRAKGHKDRDFEAVGIAKLGSKMHDFNQGRLIFPLFDEEGRVVGFSARKFLENDNGPKYINTSETAVFHKGDLLYNYHRVKEEARRKGYIYVLEGFMDVIALGRINEPSVALMGTALTPHQILLLKKMNAEVRLCLDGDAPGQSAMMGAIKPLSESKLPFRLVLTSSDEDPDELFKRVGPEGLKASLENLAEPFAFQLEYYLRSKKLSSPAEKDRAISHFLPYISSLPSAIQKEEALEKLSKATGYSVPAIRRLIKAKKPTLEQSDELELTQESKKADTSRLARAERQILYYMLRYDGALQFYKDNIDSLQTPLYQTLANYLLDYASDHKDEKLELALLLNSMSLDEDKDELKGALIDLYNEESYPPYDDDSLVACASAIAEEKQKAYDKSQFKEALSQETDEQKAKALKEMLEKKKTAIKRKKEN